MPHELTVQKQNEIGRKFGKMRQLGMGHLLDVYPEKGDWSGEDPAHRLSKIEERLAILEALRLGQRVSDNDDGSPRTVRGEYGKLVASMLIYGDLVFAL